MSDVNVHMVEDAIHDLCIACYKNSKNHGFWDKERNKGEMIALIHSEVSELLEAVRKPGQSEHIPPFTGEEEELADILIRVFDYAGGHNLNLSRALLLKMGYNASRPYKHGKAF
jgi:NTP pyrophosphatase (non-canonical NTP hydrolase)